MSIINNPNDKALLIFGSCVSRDLIEFSHATETKFILTNYFARSSLASLNSNPIDRDLTHYIEKNRSAFQRRMIKHDLAKFFYEDLRNREFDILLLDLVDQRFDLWIDGNGNILTLSTELLKTGFLDSQPEGRMIEAASPMFWELWNRGWDKFATELAAIGRLDSLRINKVFLINHTESGASLADVYPDSRMEFINTLLEKMYDRIAKDIPSHQFLEYPEKMFLAADEHQWGLSPLHLGLHFKTEAHRQLIAGAPPPAPSRPKDKEMLYHTEQWRQTVYRHRSIADAIEQDFYSEGVHQISIEERGEIDVFVKNFDRLDASPRRTIMVCFTAAVADRTGKAAPFFSGLGLAESLSVPTLAIADPILSVNRQLSLGWYAGSATVPDLPLQIAKLLDGIASKYDARLLLIGGSGGGFAALVQATLLESHATIVAWNPQTSVSDYVPDAVAAYADAAFPRDGQTASSHGDGADVPARRLQLRAVFEAANIIHDVRNRPVKSNSSIIYLQNLNDWHVEDHAGPYLAQHQWVRQGKSVFSSKDGKLIFVAGEWGQGHVAPPHQTLADILMDVMHGIPSAEFVSKLDTEVASLGAAAAQVNWFAVEPQAQVTASARIDEGYILVHCELDGVADRTGYRYAFYVLVDGKRVATRWYESSNDARLELPKADGKIELVAFVRDRLGSQRHTAITIA